MGEKIGGEASVEEVKTEEQRIEDIKRNLFDREMPPEYQHLIEGAKFIRLHTEYSENLFDELENRKNNFELTNLGQLLKSQIGDGIVVDLGCGQSDSMNLFMYDTDARLYIGVDLEPAIFFKSKRFPGSAPKPRPSQIWSDDDFVVDNVQEYVPEEPKNLIPEKPEYRLQEKTMQIKDDMLRAVSKMKSRSVKLIIMSGIETEGGDITREYISVLEREIKRVLTEDGLVLNYHSDISLPDSEPVEIDGESEGIDIRRNKEIGN